MKRLHLDALRDMAIEYIPKAKLIHAKAWASRDALHWELLTIAFLVKLAATAPAKEQAAAVLLNYLMMLSVILDEENKLTKSERKNMEAVAINAAHELCSLVERQPPAWLPPANFESEEVEPDEVEKKPKTQPLPELPRVLPQPGTMITTKQVAKLLNVGEQTVRLWASKGSGPLELRRVKAGRLNTYHADVVIKLAKEGWKKI